MQSLKKIQNDVFGFFGGLKTPKTENFQKSEYSRPHKFLNIDLMVKIFFFLHRHFSGVSDKIIVESILSTEKNRKNNENGKIIATEFFSPFSMRPLPCPVI